MRTIKQVISESGDTQREVSKVLGITESTLSLKVNGRADWRASEITALAERYGLTPEEVTEVFLSS